MPPSITGSISRETYERQSFEKDPAAYKLRLRKIIAMKRYQEEVSGFSYNGYTIKSDRFTQSILGNARQMAKDNPSYIVDWKVDTGVFVTLTASNIIAMADALAQKVQSLFTKEKNLNDQITAATTYDSIKTISW